MKQKCSQAFAGKMLLDVVNSQEFMNRVYEFAQNLCHEKIAAIESAYDIECDSEEENEYWYDEYREDAMKAIFEKLQDI